MSGINPLRHHDVPPESNPTGEGLLDRSGRPYRVWVPGGNVVVLGNSQDAERELNMEAVIRDGIPVHKRMSGGGAVLLSPGCLCLGLRFAKRKELSIHDYFAKASALISEVVLERLGLELRLRGTSDLACTPSPGGHPGIVSGLAEVGMGVDGSMERKVAGSSLYMPRDYVLYLTSILVDPDFSDIGRYLAHPSKEPDYRAGREHAAFLGALGPLSGKNVRAGDMTDWFEQKIPAVPGLDLDWELSRGG
jgi:lipoate---protein ligase